MVPVALFALGDPLHLLLRGYKDARVGEARRHFTVGLTDHLGAFLATHGGCLAASGAWDAVALVPSRRPSAGRAEHPLCRVVAGVPALARSDTVALVAGRGRVDHLRPAPDGFVADPEARGRRILLVDDTWTTGATAASAVGALSAVGARVVAVLVAGRAVDPSAAPSVGEWWRTVSARGRHPGACCLERCTARACLPPPVRR